MWKLSEGFKPSWPMDILYLWWWLWKWVYNKRTTNTKKLDLKPSFKCSTRAHSLMWIVWALVRYNTNRLWHHPTQYSVVVLLVQHLVWMHFWMNKECACYCRQDLEEKKKRWGVVLRGLIAGNNIGYEGEEAIAKTLTTRRCVRSI